MNLLHESDKTFYRYQLLNYTFLNYYKSEEKQSHAAERPEEEEKEPTEDANKANAKEEANKAKAKAKGKNGK